jgi:hypothetical protein
MDTPKKIVIGLFAATLAAHADMAPAMTKSPSADPSVTVHSADRSGHTGVLCTIPFFKEQKPFDK